MSQMTTNNILQIEQRLRKLEVKLQQAQNTTTKLSETDLVITAGLPSATTTGLKSLDAGGYTISNIKDIDQTSLDGDAVNYRSLKDNPVDLSTTVLTVGTNLSGLNMGNTTLPNVKDPVDDQDAVTKKYLEDNPPNLSTTTLIVGTNLAGLDMGSNVLPNVADPIALQDGSTKNYTDQGDDLSATTLTVGGNLGGLDMGSNVLPNMANPLLPQDGATKDYVDQVLLIEQSSPEIQQIISPGNTLGPITFGPVVSTTDVDLIDSQAGNSADTIQFKTAGVYSVIVEFCVKSDNNGFRQYLIQPTSTLTAVTTPFNSIIVGNQQDDTCYQSIKWEELYILITPALINTEWQFLGGEIGDTNNPADMYLEQYDVDAQITSPVLTYPVIPTAKIKILRREV